VSQATASELNSSTAHTSYFLWRRLHSLTGLVFGGYIIVHLLVNATLIQGTHPDVYQIQVDKIHSLPFLWAVEWIFIYLPIICHTLYGIWITVTGRPNVVAYPFGKNYFYLLQRVSALIIAAFVLFHVLAMKGFLSDQLSFDYQQATASTVRHINASFWIAYVVYPIGITASCFHLANGFWTAAITWGLTVSSASQYRWGVVCLFLFAFTLICGFLALGAAIHGGAMVVMH
jgi:succinate dehydrogenase cytochrome b subunit